jgi:hypothetical protein
MQTRSATATTADPFASVETPRSTAYLLANQLFADAPQRAAVIVKRRRLVLQQPEALEPLDASEMAAPVLAPTPTDGSRAPRVFVVARDDATAAGPAEPAPEQPTQAPRRRVEPERLPGKVVLIVPSRPEGTTPGEPMEPSPAEADEGTLSFVLQREEEHRAVQAALERVRALTADALAASKLRF